MKKLYLIAAALFAAGSFSACSDDDRENGGGDSARIVSQIISQDEDGTTLCIWKFDYDNQSRVVKIHWNDLEMLCSEEKLFSYTAGKVEITWNYYESGEGSQSYSGSGSGWATLNEQGYIDIVSTAHPYLDQYQYDKDGYLSKISWTDHYNDPGEIKCIWENGDLIEEHCINFDSMDCYYEYTSYPAKQNIDIAAILDEYLFGDDIREVGLFGRKSAHLIKSATSMYTSEEEEHCASFNYELDDNGYPIKITEIYNNRTTTYKILYK